MTPELFCIMLALAHTTGMMLWFALESSILMRDRLEDYHLPSRLIAAVVWELVFFVILYAACKDWHDRKS